MSAGTDVLQAQRQIASDYERARTLRLAGFLAPTFALFQLLTVGEDILSLSSGGQKPALTSISYAITGLCAILLIMATVAVWRKSTQWATSLLVIASAIAIIAPSFSWAFSRGVGPTVLIGLGSYSIVILLAGMLTGRVLIVIAATLAMNGLSVLVLWIAHPASNAYSALQPIVNAEITIYGPVALAIQWGVALLLIATLRVYAPLVMEMSVLRLNQDRVGHLDEIKDQFIRNVQHELRTPVTVVMGLLDLAIFDDESMPPDRRQALLLRARDASQNLVELLQNLLETPSLDHSVAEFTSEVVLVHPTLMAAAEQIEQRDGDLVERELRVTIPDNLAIWGEHVRLRQILTNVLSNAIKYSPAGTPVDVSAQALVMEESTTASPISATVPTVHPTIEITIRDYGFGIPPDQQALLFDRFVRLPREIASTIPGNGLGLYLCRTYTQAMGGSIWIESSGVPGEGSTVHLLLPAADPLPQDTAAPPQIATATMPTAIKMPEIAPAVVEPAIAPSETQA